MPLDAKHDDLSRGDTDYNRDWNRSLLNMLQRAGAIQILAIDSVGNFPVWNIAIIEASLLAAEEDDHYWDRIAALRADERNSALSDLDSFKKAIFKPDTCVSAEIFALVEAGNPLVAPCGRCAFCRAHRIDPPRTEQIRFEGLDRRWRQLLDGAARLRRGISIVHPSVDDGTIGTTLVERLVAAGVEQFVVSDREADRFASRLVGLDCIYGMVSSYSDILGAWRPALLTTAFFLSNEVWTDRLVGPDRGDIEGDAGPADRRSSTRRILRSGGSLSSMSSRTSHPFPKQPFRTSSRKVPAHEPVERYEPYSPARLCFAAPSGRPRRRTRV